jgi:hypothetical protein
MDALRRWQSAGIWTGTATWPQQRPLVLTGPISRAICTLEDALMDFAARGIAPSSAAPNDLGKPHPISGACLWIGDVTRPSFRRLSEFVDILS